MANLVVRRVDTAAVADSLQASDLERMPGAGIYRAWLASTVNTATFTITQGRENISRAQAIILRSNGVPNVSDDPPSIELIVTGEERFIVATGGTTGTIYQLHQFIPVEDL